MKSTIVKPSPIHGKGLFACRAFASGEIVEPIDGEIVAKESKSKYAIAMTQRRSLMLLNKTKYVNHGESAEQINVAFDLKKRAIVATRDIASGEELLSRYNSVFG